MNRIYWLETLQQRLSQLGVPIPILEFEDFDVANGNSRDVQLITIDDVLGGLSQRLKDEQQLRLRASRFLDKIDRDLEFGKVGPSLGNYEREYCFEAETPNKREKYFGFTFRMLLFPLSGRDTQKIESYRAGNQIVFESHCYPTLLLFGALLGGNFLNARMSWHHSYGVGKPLQGLFDVVSGKEMRALTGEGPETLNRRLSSMEPLKFIEQLAGMVVGTYERVIQ